jgi:hypothetical protein
MRNDTVKSFEDTLSTCVTPLRTGHSALGAYRENVIRIVAECDRIIQRIKDEGGTRPEELSGHLTRVSREIDKALSIFSGEKEQTGNRLRSRGNRQKLEKAYRP